MVGHILIVRNKVAGWYQHGYLPTQGGKYLQEN
jgi:hypothetical protein